MTDDSGVSFNCEYEFLLALIHHEGDPFSLLVLYHNLALKWFDKLSHMRNINYYGMTEINEMLNVLFWESQMWELMGMLYKEDREMMVVFDEVGMDGNGYGLDVNLSDGNVISALMKKDVVLKKCCVLRRWLEMKYIYDFPVINGGDIDMNGTNHFNGKVMAVDRELSKHVYNLMRAGQMGDCYNLLRNSGQHYRISTIDASYSFYNDKNFSIGNGEEREGWQLLLCGDDENLRDNRDCFGMINRGLFRSVAYKCAEGLNVVATKAIDGDDNLKYEVAIYGLVGGCLEYVIPVCKTWEDLIWAYLKCMIDDRIENELESNALVWNRSFEMAGDDKDEVDETTTSPWWNSLIRTILNDNEFLTDCDRCRIKPPLDKNLDQIFEKLPKISPKFTAEMNTHPFYLIIAYIMQEKIPHLVQHLHSLHLHLTPITKPLFNTTPNFPIRIKNSELYLRFSTHLILFFYAINRRIFESDIELNRNASNILKKYIEYLVSKDMNSLIAHYCSRLFHEDDKIQIYLEYLKSITETNKKKSELKSAYEAALNVSKITSLLVYDLSIKTANHPISTSKYYGNKSNNFDTNSMDPILQSDMNRISGLEWFSLDKSKSQHLKYILYSNALARLFIIDGKSNACSALISKTKSFCKENFNYYYKFFQNKYKEFTCSNFSIFNRKNNEKLHTSNLTKTGSYYSKGEEKRTQDSTIDDCEEAVLKESLKEFFFLYNYIDALKCYPKWYMAHMKGNDELLNCTITKLGLILYDPFGWMSYDGQIEFKDEQQKLQNLHVFGESRNFQIEQLKKICIPKITFLILNIFKITEKYDDSVAIVGHIASEHSKLYSCFTKCEMKRFLNEISSNVLINLKKCDDLLF